jgi:hypothetical protein
VGHPVGFLPGDRLIPGRTLPVTASAGGNWETEREFMKRIITSIAVLLLLLSLTVPAAAAAQAVPAGPAAQTHDASIFQSQYVRYCGQAIEDAIRDAAVQSVLKKVADMPNAAKIYDVITTGSDTLELEYELGNGQAGNALFSASRVFYDVLSQLPGTSPFWAIGTPATSCLQAAVVWDVQTGAKIGAQLRKDVDRFLSWLLPAVPASLTVRANPGHGTALAISWRENKTTLLDYLFKPSFQVGNGRQIRNASGGWDANSYAWTGLTPGSFACFTVRAANVFGDSAWASHRCAYTSAPAPQVPVITTAGTYTQGALVYFDIQYADPGHDAEGFGFVGVNGSGWAEENHPFSSPSYGIVGPDSISYPFNEECGTAQQYDSYVEAWIYDTAGQRSTPVVIHLACAGSGGSAG